MIIPKFGYGGPEPHKCYCDTYLCCWKFENKPIINQNLDQLSLGGE